MSKQPAFCRIDAYRDFARRCQQVRSHRDLFGAAWTMAQHEHPDAELAAGEATVANLAVAVNRRVQSRDAEARLAHLHDVLFEVFGLSGNVDDYYLAANSYLPEVLRSRRGNPISLTLVYCCVAEQAGIETFGVNAPGHFLAEASIGSRSTPRSLYIDPFYGGKVLCGDEIVEQLSAAVGSRLEMGPHLLRRAQARDWLMRMLNNLQATFAASGRQRDVLAMQELQALVPNSA